MCNRVALAKGSRPPRLPGTNRSLAARGQVIVSRLRQEGASECMEQAARPVATSTESTHTEP